MQRLCHAAPFLVACVSTSFLCDPTEDALNVRAFGAAVSSEGTETIPDRWSSTVMRDSGDEWTGEHCPQFGCA
ncbi:hypothetical protein CUR178_08236 [Leishmania enriettii]|uniref:Secreted protein n=1 Tax=Leishmania enriettii TaxID=5663 RepID=A0A836HG81_LEIEN|nr:hypothetical protein CUR178_08236 [Leishmania enriettii]